MKYFRKSLKLSLALLLLLGFYISCSISPIHYTSYPKSNKTAIIIAHRGASGLAPENTLSAIKKALEFKPDRIEIDIHQSKDGQVILMHDLTLDRTTDGTGKIIAQSYTELLKLDAGSWFDPVFKGEKIPLLSEAIQLINGKSTLIIELKSGNDYYPNIIENTLRIIKENHAMDWCIIHSFSTEILEEVHQLEPRIKLHKLIGGQLIFSDITIGKSIEYYDHDKYPYIEEYSVNYHFANKRIIKKVKGLGKKFNVWTVNKIEDAENLKALGVDGIITDFPNKIK